MARDFTKNVNNYLSLGTGAIGNLLSGASKIACHAWVNFDSATTSQFDNRICGSTIATGTSGIILSINKQTADYLLAMAGRAAAAETLRQVVGVTAMATGAWHSVGGQMDIGGDTITIYTNGTSATGSTAFTATTYTIPSPGTDYIGSVSAISTINQLDGRIAEVAFWRFDSTDAGLDANAFSALSKGFSARFVRPDALVFYMPLMGRNSPEVDLMGNGAIGTITGSLPQDAHPRIIYPSRAQRTALAAAPTGNPWYAYAQM